MQVVIKSVEVNKLTLTPTLNVTVNISYNIHDYPFSISAVLISSDGKECAFFNENEVSGFTSSTIYPPKNNIRGDEQAVKNDFILSGTISPQAIDHIEELREHGNRKEVYFRFAILIKTLNIPSPVVNQLSIAISRHVGNITIGQSEWERDYAPALGIGKFILLEFQIPEEDKVSEEWTELYDRLFLAIQDIESSINHGDWKKALMEARIFFDNLYVGKKGDGYESFKKKIGDLFIKDQHDDDGINAFLNGIENFFNVYSKFVHSTNKRKEAKPLPIPTKEDAYFCYVLAIGILNIIGKKASKA